MNIEDLNNMPLPLEELQNRYVALAMLDVIAGAGTLLGGSKDDNFIPSRNHWCWMPGDMLELEFYCFGEQNALLLSHSFGLECHPIPLSNLPQEITSLQTYESDGNGNLLATFIYLWNKEHQSWQYIEYADKNDIEKNVDYTINEMLSPMFIKDFTLDTNMYYSSWVDEIIKDSLMASPNKIDFTKNPVAEQEIIDFIQCAEQGKIALSMIKRITAILETTYSEKQVLFFADRFGVTLI